jgi:hypothetical protein
MLRKLKPRAKDRRDMFMRDPETGKRIVDAWRSGNFQFQHRIGLADSLEEALAMVEAYRASVAHLPEPIRTCLQSGGDRGIAALRQRIPIGLTFEISARHVIERG